MSEIAISAGASSITFADVVEALGDTDISTTNASKLRSILGGRGSFSTIHKHLDTIRAQRIQAQQPAAVPVPAAPPELLQMWGAAVQIATAQVRIRLDAVVQTRDMLTGDLVVSRGDVASLTAELEGLIYQLEASEQECERATEAAQAAEQARQIAEQAQAADSAQAALNAQEVEQVHAVELIEKGVELERLNHQVTTVRLESQLVAQTLQSTIDRLTDQVGELKSLLHGAKPSAQAV